MTPPRLERYEYAPASVHGSLFLGNGTVLKTLERPWRDNEPFVSCVPEGIYELVRHMGTKYQDTWALDGETVAPSPEAGRARSTCVFHAGNTVRDTTGCVLVGLERVGDELRGSREAMNLLREAWRPQAPMPALMIVNTSGGAGTGPADPLSEPVPAVPVQQTAPVAVGEMLMKSFIRSKTLWFNVLGGGLGVFLTGLENSQVDGQVAAGVLMFGNIVLRFLTSTPISISSAAPPSAGMLIALMAGLSLLGAPKPAAADVGECVGTAATYLFLPFDIAFAFAHASIGLGEATVDALRSAGGGEPALFVGHIVSESGVELDVQSRIE